MRSRVNLRSKPMPKPKKLCPRCGEPGSGPYSRYVLNPLKKRYEPYYYFCHRIEGKIKWCYIPKKMINEEKP